MLSNYAKISNNIITENRYGIYAATSFSTIERNNIILNSHHGIYVGSHTPHNYYNLICDNNISNNANKGLAITDASYQTIVRNTIMSNHNAGLYFFNCIESDIYHNNIIDNNLNAYESGSGPNTQWDDNISVGNYWSDWSGSGPYVIQLGPNYDNYPATNPFPFVQ